MHEMMCDICGKLGMTISIKIGKFCKECLKEHYPEKYKEIFGDENKKDNALG